MRHGATLVDRAALRKVVAARAATDAPEYVRINVDLGAPVVLHAFVWGLAAPDLYPTLTVHGSNNRAFLRDHRVTIGPRTTAGAVFTTNAHALAFDAAPLWELRFHHAAGSTWSPADAAGDALDLYYTRLTSGPRYSRLAADGTVAAADVSATFTGHVAPATDVTAPVAYQYYALTISVGRMIGTTERHILEVMQFQPIIEAPPPAVLSQTGDTAVLYGLSPPASSTTGEGVVDLTLSKDVPAGTTLFGYGELWTSFRTRGYFTQGREWTGAGDAQQGPWNIRASVSLPEVLLPRSTLIRTRNAAVTTLPYLWVFVRMRSVRPIDNQGAVIQRQFMYNDRAPPPTGAVAAPDWVTHRDTLRFLLVLGSSRIPGECQFLTLSTDSVVPVMVTDAPGSSLPEVCITLPSGEVLDFRMYDDDELPREVPHDEWSGIHATVRLNLLAELKRPRLPTDDNRNIAANTPPYRTGTYTVI